MKNRKVKNVKARKTKVGSGKKVRKQLPNWWTKGIAPKVAGGGPVN